MSLTGSRSCARCSVTPPRRAPPGAWSPSGWRGFRLAEDGDPLGLSPEAMRALGYRTVDMLVEQLSSVRGGPALRRASPAQMHERLPAPPDQPRSFEALIRELE